MARAPVPDSPPPRTGARTWSSRLAWGVLVAGGGLIALRVAFATAVPVHGDGMAPTLLDGDHVLLLRGTWSVDRGDVVIYAASLPTEVAPAATPRERDAPRSHREDGSEFPDARRAPQGELRNTAVVDPEELGEALDENWRVVQARADAGLATRTAYRVGRVLARPGDRVALVRERGGLGLAIEGQRVEQKEGAPLELRLEYDDAARARRVLWEQTGPRRYQVLDTGAVAPQWQQLLAAAAELASHDDATPPTHDDDEVVAPGYLVLADNRDEGRCCDSRVLGWISPEAIRGEVLARLGGNTTAVPDQAPGSRGFQWKP